MNMKTKAVLGAAALGLTLSSGICIGVAMADQPHMENALDALHTARHELEIALDDKGGHRIAAIRDVDAAIDEVHAGMHVGWEHGD
jgi:hypothetical protein